MNNENFDFEFLSLSHRNLNMPTLETITNDLKTFKTIYNNKMYDKEAHKHLMLEILIKK